MYKKLLSLILLTVIVAPNAIGMEPRQFACPDVSLYLYFDEVASGGSVDGFSLKHFGAINEWFQNSVNRNITGNTDPSDKSGTSKASNTLDWKKTNFFITTPSPLLTKDNQLRCNYSLPLLGASDANGKPEFSLYRDASVDEISLYPKRGEQTDDLSSALSTESESELIFRRMTWQSAHANHLNEYEKMTLLEEESKKLIGDSSSTTLESVQKNNDDGGMVVQLADGKLYFASNDGTVTEIEDID